MKQFKISSLQMEALPDEVKELVVNLLEGKVKTLIVVAELQDNHFLNGVFVYMEGSTSHRYAMVGALESVKRDFMRMEVGSRVNYVEIGDIIFEDDDNGDMIQEYE